MTLVALLVSSISGIFLERNRFSGRGLLISILTFPLAFPGVVIGFLVIMIGGRQGLVGVVSRALTGDRWVFAYSMLGLFILFNPTRHSYYYGSNRKVRRLT